MMVLAKVIAAAAVFAVAGGILVAWDVLQQDAWTKTQQRNEIGHWTGERRFAPTVMHLDYGQQL